MPSRLSFFLASLIVLAPLYVWRFSIPVGGSAGGGLPTNFLMLANFVVIGVGISMALSGGTADAAGVRGFSLQSRREKLKKAINTLGTPLIVAITVFGLASIISLFAFGINVEKLGQWIVLYAQPLVIFILIRYFLLSEKSDEAQSKWKSTFRTAAYIVVGAAGALALVQYFTLLTLPPQWWGNANEPKRAIAFFAHANAFGLFMTPLLAWLIPDVVERVRSLVNKTKLSFGGLLMPMLWTLGVAGMFFSLSRGAWLGFGAAVAVYAIVSANKKIIIGLVVTALVLAGVVAAVPNLRYRVTLPFQGEKSTVARFSLWDTAGKMIKDSPVLGKGVNGFSDNWNNYNTDPGLEHYNFPHNILLNTWVDLGLLGVVSMLAVLLVSAWQAFLRRNESLAAFGLLLYIVAVIGHGLIDIPYFKNDLALVFWIVMSLGVYVANKKQA